MGSRPEEHYLLILKERTSPVWITSLSPDASLSKKNYATSPTLVQPTWEGGEKEENEDLSQWLYIERRLGPRSTFRPELKVTRYFIISSAILRAWKRIGSWYPPHLVMPPGPGPTSTTWQPAREPPDLATRSSSLGSIMKFWESRFWAWKRNFSYIPSTTQMLLNV